MTASVCGGAGVILTFCRHCNVRPPKMPRGLCYPCYHKPGVRDKYHSGSKYARQGVAHKTPQAIAPFPTSHLPGSEGKIAVLAERAAAGYKLWHPLDAGGSPESFT